MKKVTISDVAKLAGVSNATVSAVINHKNNVKDSTKRSVLQAIKTLNYRPRASARQRFQSTQEKSIGLIVKEIHNPYFADIIVGAQEVANRKGYNLVVASSERVLRSERRLVELLVAKDIDGLIINPLLEDDADLSHLFEIKQRNIPFVLLESIRGLQASLVDVDNVRASQEAVHYLIELGHERIVHFAGPQYSTHSNDRIEGMRRAFSESHLMFSNKDIVLAGARLEDGYAAGLAFFKACCAGERAMPTAVTCYNDLVAIGVRRALLEVGLRVPEDMSLIGYDDINIAEYLSVPLTTVRVPKIEKGAKAAEILIQNIENADPRTVEKVYLQAKLIVRASTRALVSVPHTVDS